MRSLKLAAFLGLLLAAPAAAEFRPSPLADIYNSYNDCFKVATKNGINSQVLNSLGWSRATASKDGQQIKEKVPIFGHAERAPLILLSAEKEKGLCIVMARLESAGSFEEFKKPWGGKLPEPDAEGNVSFVADGHIVQLRQTGTRQEPSMTIAVMTPLESK